MGRVQDRAGFEIPARLTLVETDADGFDRRLDQFLVELSGLRKVLVGILVSLATASVLLAVNLVVGVG